MSPASRDGFEIFFGDANNATARVYARISGQPPDCVLSGELVGPVCEYSRTLPAKIPFVPRPFADQSGESALVAEAIVPDPCFWSGEMPFLYQAHLELRQGANLLATETRPFGIRPLGVLRRRLILEGRTWVLRGVQSPQLPDAPLPDWREADLAMYVTRPSEELCSDASRLGVVLVVELDGDAASLADRIRRLAKWPAVAIAVLTTDRPLGHAIRQVAPNLLLAGYVSIGEPALVPGWADMIVCEDTSAEDLAERTRPIAKPVLAMRSAGRRETLVDARRECDLLQRDLAGRGEFAGYVV